MQRGALPECFERQPGLGYAALRSQATEAVRSWKRRFGGEGEVRGDDDAAGFGARMFTIDGVRRGEA